MTPPRCKEEEEEGGKGKGKVGGVGVALHNKRIGRQPSFPAKKNPRAPLPACPAHGALPETDGSRNVLERSSAELRVAREAR